MTDESDRVRELTDSAMGLRQQGGYDEAKKLLEQALEISERNRSSDPPGYATCLGMLGGLLFEMGEVEIAQPLLEKAVSEHRALRNWSSLVDSLNSLAQCHTRNGRFAEAELLYSEAATINAKEPDSDQFMAGITLQNWAMVKLRSGDLVEYKRLVREAIRTHRANQGDSRSAEQSIACLGRLADTCFSAGQYGGAEGALRELLQVYGALGRASSEPAVEIMSKLFSLLIRQNRIADAARVWRDAFVQDAATVWKQLTSLPAPSREKALRQSRDSFDRFLSNIIDSLNHPEAVRVAVDVLLWRRGIGLDLFRCASQFARSDPQLKANLEAMNNARAEWVGEILAAPRVDMDPAHATKLYIEGIERSYDYQALESKVFGGLDYEKWIAASQPVDCAAVAGKLPAQSALVEFWRCRRYLTSGAVQPRYLAFVLPAGDPSAVRLIDLCAADEIDDRLLNEYLAAVTGDDPQRTLPRGLTLESRQIGDAGGEPRDARELGIRLRKLVFDPLLETPGDVTHLFIVPDGLLSRLPFAVLPRDEAGYLIDSPFVISYLNSGRDLCARAWEEERVAVQPPVVVAAPDFDLALSSNPTEPARLQPGTEEEVLSLYFTPLTGAAIEGQKVAEFLDVRQLIVGGAATERRVKQIESPGILHLATHGGMLPATPLQADFDIYSLTEFKVELRGMAKFGEGLGRLSGRPIPNQAMRSVLALAGVNTWLMRRPVPEEAEDGLLTAEDVGLMDLSGNELTVLSACETALGSIQVGESVLGLRSGFALAGTKTLMMSLWKVPDAQTLELMDSFYDNLLNKRMGRAKALHEAQLLQRGKHPDQPFNWGAFICVGETGPLPNAVIPNRYHGPK